MREAEPMTQTMTVTTVREHWSATITAVFRRQTRVVLEKAGIPVAALVSPEDLERLRRWDAEQAAHLAPLVDHAEYAGNWPIANDPYSGVKVVNGKLVLPDRPGLGLVKR